MKTILLLELGMSLAAGAAPFQNLDFDSGTPNVVEPLFGVGPRGYGPAADILPGWKLTEQDVTIKMGYDVMTAGASLATIADRDYAYYNRDMGGIAMPFEGRFSLLLFPLASAPGELIPYSLQQHGTIPSDAKSIRFFNYGAPFEVRLNNQAIELTYQRYRDPAYPQWDLAHVAGDVSAFAGQDVELTFTTLRTEWDQGPIIRYMNGLDSISFSAQPIPEPTVCWLLGLGGALLWISWTKR
jgi:hypothetical protein